MLTVIIKVSDAFEDDNNPAFSLTSASYTFGALTTTMTTVSSSYVQLSDYDYTIGARVVKILDTTYQQPASTPMDSQTPSF